LRGIEMRPAAFCWYR